MKVTDLMLGDWVKIIHHHKPKPSIKVKKVDLGDFSDALLQVYPEITYEPIPLTLEILEKNAIISESTVCIKIDNVLFPICNIFWEDSTKTEINCLLLQNYVGQMIVPTIKYVHEFQHLLRILKIEKEIVL